MAGTSLRLHWGILTDESEEFLFGDDPGGCDAVPDIKQAVFHDLVDEAAESVCQAVRAYHFDQHGSLLSDPGGLTRL